MALPPHQRLLALLSDLFPVHGRGLHLSLRIHQVPGNYLHHPLPKRLSSRTPRIRVLFERRGASSRSTCAGRAADDTILD